MAEAILRSRNIAGVSVRSAGIHAVEGAPISMHAQTLIERANMPYTPTSSVVTEEGLAWADVVLTMTGVHEQTLCSLFPEEKEKIHTLKEFLRQSGTEDVHDPFGGTLQTYEETFEELTRLMEIFEQKMIEG